MAILIKGIDLPKGARYADISFLDKFGMPVGDKYIEEAIQIPRPHGRLIDEDEIFKIPHCGECNDATLDAIVCAPTILESED